MATTLTCDPPPDRKHAVSLMRIGPAQCRFIISEPAKKPDLLRSAHEWMQLVRLASGNSVSQPIFSGGSLILRRGFWAVSGEPS